MATENMKIPAAVVAIRFQMRHVEEIHVKRRYFNLAAILNWFGSEHLHHRFWCQEHHTTPTGYKI